MNLKINTEDFGNKFLTYLDDHGTNPRSFEGMLISDGLNLHSKLSLPEYTKLFKEYGRRFELKFETIDHLHTEFGNLPITTQEDRDNFINFLRELEDELPVVGDSIEKITVTTLDKGNKMDNIINKINLFKTYIKEETRLTSNNTLKDILTKPGETDKQIISAIMSSWKLPKELVKSIYYNSDLEDDLNKQVTWDELNKLFDAYTTTFNYLQLSGFNTYLTNSKDWCLKDEFKDAYDEQLTDDFLSFVLKNNIELVINIVEVNKSIINFIIYHIQPSIEYNSKDNLEKEFIAVYLKAHDNYFLLNGKRFLIILDEETKIFKVKLIIEEEIKVTSGI